MNQIRNKDYQSKQFKQLNSSNDIQSMKNEKRTSQQNFLNIFDNLIQILKELKARQVEIQEYVQKEILDMNQKLNSASNELLLAIQQMEKDEKDFFSTEQMLNRQKQKQTQYFNTINENKRLPQMSNKSETTLSKVFMRKQVSSDPSQQSKNAIQNLFNQNTVEQKQSSSQGNQIIRIKSNNREQHLSNNNFMKVQTTSNREPYYLNSQNKTNQSSNSKIDGDNSLLQTQFAGQSICYYCNKIFESGSIITPCYHNYHDSCLKEHYQNMLDKYKIQKQLVCLCKTKLTQLFFKKSLKIDLENLFQQQILLIKDKLKNEIGSCIKCKFFWIKRNTDTQTKKCMNCDQNGVIQLITQNRNNQ